MPRSTTGPHPGRTLLLLGGIVALLAAILAGGVLWSNASWAPKLALDLEGGTQITLTAQVAGTTKVTQQQLDQAVSIIRQRVDASGVSEAEITTSGGRNVVVSLPGNPDERTRELVRASAQLRFRPVLAAAAGTPTASPTATGTATPQPTGTATGGSSAKATESVRPSSSPRAAGASATDGALRPLSVPGATSTTAPAAASSATPSPAATGGTSSGTSGKPANASDPAWITPALEKQFTALDCSSEEARRGGGGDDPAKPLVTCEQDGSIKYILGPVEVEGKDIKDASAGLVSGTNGVTTNQWAVNLSFNSAGSKAFGEVTTRLYQLQQQQQSPRDQFAIVLDGLVVSAPQSNAAITDGQAQITGNFNEQSATALANQLKYGALPIAFKVQTEQQISATLGSEQLARGMLAGLIGLALVVVYSLLQYRTLGLVTVASLVVAGVFAYLFITILSWREGYRLSLAGVAGLIVSIGITADSFIVYFERVRDQLRDGKSLPTAVTNGWPLARRTILASDGVNFLAAITLFVLAVGGVQGFALTLGLTTIIDLMVVCLFTHPTLQLLSRTKFFSEGHHFSGLDPRMLGVGSPRYRGRGSFSYASHQRAAEEAAAAGKDEGVGPDADASDTTGAPAVAADGHRLTVAERRARAERATREERTGGAVATAEHDPGSGQHATDDDTTEGRDA